MILSELLFTALSEEKSEPLVCVRFAVEIACGGEKFFRVVQLAISLISFTAMPEDRAAIQARSRFAAFVTALGKSCGDISQRLCAAGVVVIVERALEQRGRQIDRAFAFR